MQIEIEKRRFPRVDSTCMVYVEQQDEGGEIVLQTLGRTIDLSVCGILVECHRPHAMAGPIRLTLSGYNQMVECSGTSLRCERLTEDLWTIAVELQDSSRQYLRHVSAVFADAG